MFSFPLSYRFQYFSLCLSPVIFTFCSCPALWICADVHIFLLCRMLMSFHVIFMLSLCYCTHTCLHPVFISKCAYFVRLCASIGGQLNILAAESMSQMSKLQKSFPLTSTVSDLYSYFHKWGPLSLCDLLHTSSSGIRPCCLIFHCDVPVSPAIWTPYPWLSCRSYARAGWPSATSASWRAEPRNTGLSSPLRACLGSRMMRWLIHTHTHAWITPRHVVIWAIF